MKLEGNFDGEFDITPPSTPRRKKGDRPRIYTSTPIQRRHPTISIDDDEPSPAKKSTPSGSRSTAVRRIENTPDAAMLRKADENRRIMERDERGVVWTYRVEPMAGQMIRGCQRVAQAPRKPAIQEQTTVRRSPRLQKQRQAEVPSAQLYLLDENNNGEKGHETLHHSNSSRSASKLVLDTSAEVRNWCRAHSNIDRAAPFVVFVLFMALMFYLASLLHAANVPSNVLKMAANAFHSLADHISHLRQ